MHSEPLVSIIIPVYNAKEYLRRCVDSVLNQEFRNFELILANDGSTDGSGTICDDYRSRDSRVHVIHKENTGVSDTRNRALLLARGVYIQFIDSDDWITPEATHLLIRSMEQYPCDMVISDFYRVSGDHLAHKGDINETRVLTREEFCSFMMENPADFYYGVLWNKLYKREIIEKNHIRMDTRISWCEDFLFNLEYIRHAHSFYALQAPIYYYVKRKGSLVSQSMNLSSSLRMKINVFEYYQEFYKDIYDQEDYNNIRSQLYRFLLSVAKDGSVLPLPLSGTKKLGSERHRFHDQALQAEGFPMDLYRFRKLLEYQLQTIARKNNLTLEECSLLCHLYYISQYETLRELADFAGLSLQKTTYLLQRLEKKKLIRRREEEKTIIFSFLPKADHIQKDLELMEQDCDSVRFASFTEEERDSCQEFSRRIQENISDFLSRM